MIVVRSPTIQRDGHDGVRCGSPKFLGSLEDIALIEFAVGRNQELTGGFGVFCRDHRLRLTNRRIKC